MTGTLYIISTPIGNLEDITLRALRILKGVDLIAAEDVRHSLRLLNHYGISKPMISYWKAREQVKSEILLRKLQSGKSVGLISDAGTPGIADPGMLVIQKAILNNIQVISVPGPTACIAALTLSGISTKEFTFIGFLPARKSQRQKLLKELSIESRTLVLYEAPHRIVETLQDMMVDFHERTVSVVKEMTKIHEKVFRGSIVSVLNEVQETKVAGEYIVIVEGRAKEVTVPIDEALFEVGSLMKHGVTRKEAVKKIAKTYGLSKRELYERSIHQTT